MLTQASVTTQRASRTASAGSSVSATSAPCAAPRPPAPRAGAACRAWPGSERKPKRAAASIQVRATLLPSPHQATVWPAIGPRCSSKVITSAISWQGWLAAVRPLITGTVACAAISVQPLRAVGAQHDRVHVARQHARGVGHGLAAAESASPPPSARHVAAELAHRHLEADAGAGARACRRPAPGSLPGQRPRPRAGALVGCGGVEHPAQGRRVEVAQVEEVAGAAAPRRAGRRCAGGAQASPPPAPSGSALGRGGGPRRASC